VAAWGHAGDFLTSPSTIPVAALFSTCAFFVKPGQFDELIRTVVEMNEDWITEHCPLT
jgi:hypothetical protein